MTHNSVSRDGCIDRWYSYLNFTKKPRTSTIVNERGYFAGASIKFLFQHQQSYLGKTRYILLRGPLNRLDIQDAKSL